MPKSGKATNASWSSSHPSEGELDKRELDKLLSSAQAKFEMIGIETTEDRVAIAIQVTRMQRTHAASVAAPTPWMVLTHDDDE